MTDASGTRRTNLLVAVIASLLSLAVAGAIYWTWWRSDVELATESLAAHIQALSDLEPGVDYRLPSYPAPGRMAEVPTFGVRLNQWGIREREFAPLPAEGVRRIIATGASPTFGNGVEYGDRFTERIGKALEERHPGCCEVINAGKLGLSTPTAVQWVKGQIVQWKPSVLLYSTMSNDIRHPSDTLRFHITPEKLATYERLLRELVAFCRERGIAVVFWANTTARADMDPLQQHRRIMLGVARDEEGAWAVDLQALYRRRPATPEEIEEYLANTPWTELYDDPSGGLPLERTALHVDWVHPNAFGNERLAEGLLPLVEQALGLEGASAPIAGTDAPTSTIQQGEWRPPVPDPASLGPARTVRISCPWELPFVQRARLMVATVPAGGGWPPFGEAGLQWAGEVDTASWPIEVTLHAPDTEVLVMLDLDETGTPTSGDPSSLPVRLAPAGDAPQEIVLDRILPDRPGVEPRVAPGVSPAQ